MRKSILALIAVWASTIAALPAEGVVTLELRPSTQSVPAGQQVEVQLYAVADPAEPVGVLQVVLQWDPSFLTLTGHDLTGAPPWQSSGFPGGGLNSDYSDGDAYFTASVNPCAAETASPAGLLVTTLLFDAGTNLGASSVAILSTLNGFDTRVYDNLTLFGCGGVVVPSAIGQSASVTVQACTAPAECGDGSACTNDLCTAGICENVLNYDDTQFCCDPSTGGLTTLSDGNECTQDFCNADTGQVTHPPKLAGTACGDQTDTTCTDPDTCNGAGTCLPNHATNGNFCELDGDSCTNDACLDGACAFVDSDADGTLCDDGQDNCTPGQDECQAGVCTGTGADPCVGQTGDFCLEVPQVGPDCPFGDPDCAGFPDSTCDLDPLDPKCRRDYTCGECRPFENDCPDDGDCYAPTCSISGICLNFLENDLCQDGTYCNGTEVCEGIFNGDIIIGGQCVVDQAPPCSGTGLVCREETCCDGQTCGEGLCQCVECNVNADCDDSNPCNGLESCDQVNFTCVAGTSVDCTHLDDQCVVGVCNTLSGLCETQPDNIGFACNDGVACTANDTCTAEGLCVGTEEVVNGTVDLQWDDTVFDSTKPSQAVGEMITFDVWTVANDGQICSVTGTPCPGGAGDCSFLCAIDGVTPCATSNDCIAVGGGFCNVQQQCILAEHDLTVVQAIIDFDPTVLQLVGFLDPCTTTPGDCIECETDADCAALGTTCHCPGGPPCPVATNPGVCVTGKYDWGASGFPTSPGSDPDGINLSSTDGEIFYLANARSGVSQPEPKAPVLATQPLWVTTIQFLAIDGAANTVVSFDTCVGDTPTRTRIIGDGAGNLITGDRGTVSIQIRECATPADCDDSIACTTDDCDANFQCVHTPDDQSCVDSVFCNGVETCDPQSGCVSPGDPCTGQGLVCKEPPGECVECLSDPDCDDGLVCTADTCNGNVCEYTDTCTDDGVFCNGVEFCSASSNSCESSGDPCPGFCNEGIGCPGCDLPIVESVGPRYLAITPQPEVNPSPTAFLVTSPDWPCLSKYVGAFLRCGGTGAICNSDADCNACTLLNSPCVSDADCKTCQGSTNPCQTSADCGGGVCESVQVCQLSGLTCDSSGFFDEIDINADGLPDGIVATLVDDPADRAILTAEEWGTTSYPRCSQSQEPCSTDSDCDIGQCDVSGRACSITADDCRKVCAIAHTECSIDSECVTSGDTCTVLQSCLPFETCQAGKVFVLSPDIFPSDVDRATDEFFPISYSVAADCGAVSDPVTVQMRLWADSDDNGVVNIADALLAILGFQGKYLPSIPPRNLVAMDIEGPSCTPNQKVTINDVFQIILAFKGDRFDPDYIGNYAECSEPCP